MRAGLRAQDRRALVWSAATALIGAVVLVAGAIVAPAAAAASYFVAYTATVAVVVGMLLMLMITQLSGAVWFVPLQRSAQAVVAALPALALLGFGLRLPNAAIVGRTVAYWVIWVALGEGVGVRFTRGGAVALAALASVAMTFAAFDWMMALTPEWSSTVYGAYYVIGGSVGALALLAVLTPTVPNASRPTAQHLQALGRLTLAFVLCWAYLWYVQFFIIWIADLPRETTWYFARLQGGWRVLTTTVVVSGCVVPFVLLVFRAARGSMAVMAAAGVWLLVSHYLDVYWLIVPSLRPAWALTHIVWDVAALAFVAGTTTVVALLRRTTVAVTTDDPMRDIALQYQAH